jgi:hypothetical protein
MVDIIIARLFLTVRRYRGCYIVRVESSLSEAMDNQDFIPMLYTINGFLNSKILHIRYLDDPPVIDILERIARHLLLLTGPPTICIPHRVDMFMAVRSGTRLIEDYGAKTSL